MNTKLTTLLILLGGQVFTGAVPVQYQALLTGAAEFPSNASPGIGTALVTIDTEAHTLRVQTSFSGLLGNTTAAHIHGPTEDPLDITDTAGVMTQTPTFIDFPLGVKAGTYDETFDTLQAGTYNASFLNNPSNLGIPANAEAALATFLAEGRTYLNIHTALPEGFPGGEIRGFLVPAPDGGATGALLLLALAGGIAVRRYQS